MKRRIIKSVGNYDRNLSQEDAHNQLKNEYPNIPWKYYGWSSHSDSYIFDALVPVEDIPKAMQSYETSEDTRIRIAQAVEKGKSCTHCRFLSNSTYCKHIANTQPKVTTGLVTGYTNMLIHPNFICTHFEEKL